MPPETERQQQDPEVKQDPEESDPEPPLPTDAIEPTPSGEEESDDSASVSSVCFALSALSAVDAAATGGTERPFPAAKDLLHISFNQNYGRSARLQLLRRLHPEIQASQEGARVTTRRIRLHGNDIALDPVTDEDDILRAILMFLPRTPPAPSFPLPEIQTIAQIRTCRRQHPQIHMPTSLPDVDDMLREILLRLPLQPSSLPRAAAVCKRWRGRVTDPKFHHQFYAYHRNPPLLGVFERTFKEGIVFTPILDPPDRIPPERFTFGHYRNGNYDVLDCRHGLLLLILNNGLVVCDPITGEQLHVPIPTDLGTDVLGGAVLCAATDPGHVHGGCDSSPFKVVLLTMGTRDSRHVACVYSSQTGVWGDPVSTGARCEIHETSSVLLSNRLYWLTMLNMRIVEFDLDEHSITWIEGPPVTFDITYGES